MHRIQTFALSATLLFAAVTARAAIITGPYLQSATTSGVTVCWVTDRDSVGQVSCSPEQPGRQSPQRARERKPARYHRVRLSHLAPFTLYSYTVESDQNRRGPFTFRTAAPPSQPFKFVAYGDTRTQPRVHAAVIERIRKFGPDFVIQTGDLVANGSKQELWDNEFWPVVEPLVESTPYYPCLGNHEGHGAPYFRYFPGCDQYSFDYGNIHFAAIDSDCPPSEYPAQQGWLRKDLAAHQRATWRVVFMHHTPYTCCTIAGRREAAERLRTRLDPILRAEHVQLVISGHDHTYQRHENAGITYVVSGGGGAPLYPVRPDTPYVKVAKSVYNECEFTVNGDHISVRAVEPDGKVVDQFELSTGK